MHLSMPPRRFSRHRPFRHHCPVPTQARPRQRRRADPLNRAPRHLSLRRNPRKWQNPQLRRKHLTTPSRPIHRSPRLHRRPPRPIILRHPGVHLSNGPISNRHPPMAMAPRRRHLRRGMVATAGFPSRIPAMPLPARVKPMANSAGRERSNSFRPISVAQRRSNPRSMAAMKKVVHRPVQVAAAARARAGC